MALISLRAYTNIPGAVFDEDQTSVFFAEDALEIKKALQDGTASIKTEGITIVGLTQGSVLFAGADGVLSEDNDGLFWDDTLKRLGIGTASPASDLHLKSTAPVLTIEATNLQSGLGINVINLDTAARPALRLQADGTTIFQVLRSGNTSIGTTSDLAQLAVVNDVAGDDVMQLRAAASQTSSILRCTTSAGTTLTELDGNGNLILRTTYIEGLEISDPSAPAANRGRLYFRDNGAGKTQLVCLFNTGPVQVVAEEP